METTSLSLLEALRQSPDTPEWGRFVRLYEPLLKHWAASQKFAPQYIDDLAQEVLIKLLKALPEYEKSPGGSFRSWLFRLTVNTGHDFRRRVATRKLPDAAGLSGAEEESPLVEMEKAEYLRELSRHGLALIRAEFSEQTMAAYTLAKIEGRAASDIAAELGISANAVYLAINRVMTRLREVLKDLID